MNTFGTASLQFPLCDPRSVVADRRRFRREMLPLLQRVNHFYCPAGRYPLRGWLLLPRSEYDQLDRYSTVLQLHIADPTKADNVAVLKNLSIVQARCVTRGIASDPSALYLVEVIDGRGVLHSKWSQFPTNSQYNVRAAAYPEIFHTGSMSGGTTWTWETMLSDLWAQAGAHLGAWPGLPDQPFDTPENFWFSGVPLWPALCEVLDYLGLTVAHDPTSATPYTVVRPGTDDAAHSLLETRYSDRVEDDLEWIDVGAARVPGTVIVYFRRRNEVYGTEETVRRDSLQWSTNAVYSVSVPAPAAFTGAVGTHHLWSDFTVRYDTESAPLAADVATAAAIAADSVQDYFDVIYSRSLGHMNRTYTGALPFKTGSLVDGVCWYMGYGPDGDYGWRTKISRGDDPPWPEVYEDYDR